jgi:hypothetical protein
MNLMRRLQVSLRSLGWVVLAAVLFWGTWAFTRTGLLPDSAGTGLRAAHLDPAATRQQEILKASIGRPGDPELMARYASLNVRHFAGELKQAVVRWEAALADVGPLSGQGITLQGMFGTSGSDLMILLNPVLKDDEGALDRALCHEMVHAYLFAGGDASPGHGPAFQAVLERLAGEGAFEGIAAQPDDKARLKAWLAAESVRIDEERRALDALDQEMKQTSGGLEREIEAFNARAARPADEAEDLARRRTQYNERAVEANDRVQRFRDDVAHFNGEAARYNLMIVYPDGLDAAEFIASKQNLSGATGR